LVGKGNWTDEQAATLAERIYYWTDGQPYLTQLLCSYLGPDATPADVGAGVERLRREDENHLPPMLERLNHDERLCKYVERILAGEHIKFYPRENRRQAQLELLGVIKEDAEGFCTIRNRIYERVLAGIAGLTVGPSTSAAMLHPELNDALTRRTLALFIGADLPREVTGLPARSDLARDLARRKGLDESLSLAEVAQRVSQAGNRWEFTDFIRSALDTTGKSPQPFHQRIVALVKERQIETIITTAYDNLLELAFQEAGAGINRVVRGSDVSFINPDRPTLIKLYGDAQQPDTLVVTDRDHSNLLRDREREALVDEVRRAFRRNTVLFLGYNLTDPDFRFLFDQVAESRFARTAYAVWPGLPKADVRMWRDRGIVILDVDPLGILGEVGIPPVSPHCLEPTVVSPVSELSIGGKDMDFERGLDAFKRLAEGTDWYQDFTVHEASLRDNLRDERRYGPSEQTRRDRTRIVDQLNALALEHLGISFNDLCMGKQPPPLQPPTKARGDWDTERLQRETVEQQNVHNGPFEIKETKASFERALESFVRRIVQQNHTELMPPSMSWHVLRRRRPESEQRRLPYQDKEQRDWDYITNIEEADSIKLTIDPFRGLSLELTEKERGLWVTINPEGDRDSVTVSENGRWVHKGWRHIRVDPQGHAILSAWLADLAQEGTNHKSAQPMDIFAKPKKTYHGTGIPWAVLVGVNEYEDSANYGQLQVCVKDVEAIHKQLVAGGFDPARIRLLTDQTGELPTKANILVALKAVADATEPDDLLLFYYSGHGDEAGGESYLVARDGRRLVLGDTAVPLSRVREIVEGAPARAKIIVLDACHSGADIGGKGPKPMSEAFIRRVFEQAEGMAVLASCKQGQLSYEWRENERSIFTHFLLEALEGQADRDEKGFVTVQDTNRHVTNGVKLWASQRNLSQTPTLQYTVAGDIILVRHQ
ncbi:MAG: caspase family protein, partial [Anaerolineae bacterium]|nr:caspase family protein [Anaerolineae bacterium]